MSRISRVSDAGAVALLCGIVIGLALLSLAGLAHGQERPRKPVVCSGCEGSEL